MKRHLKITAGLSLIVFVLLAAKPSTNDNYFAIIKNLDIFASLYKELNSYYVDELNPNTLIKTGIDAMLASLDPYTNYIPEDKIENYRTMTTGEYGGIGALVQRVNDVNTVLMIYEGYPADDAGMKIGDKILEINGIDLADKSSSEISTLLKGQSRSGIQLKVERVNRSEPFNITVSREKISIKNVPYSGMVNENVGYLKLTDFTQKAGLEVKNAVKELKEKGAKNIIVDLRGNPGGLLQEAVNISNVFIPKGKEVVTTKGKFQTKDETYRTLNEPVDTEIPLIVLTGSSSASASEIVAGVMQDYDRGVLVGRKTFGKGLVQISRQLSYNNQLKVTTAKYYIPSGRCIQAIDYSHRNPDGSVGKIPDSLKVAFKTFGGRTVYDGGGVDPDILVDEKDFAPVTRTLTNNYLIFNYATRYFYDHESIGDPKDFKLTDKEYADFVKWLSDKDYEYETELEIEIAELIKNAKEQKNSQSILDNLAEVKSEIKEIKANDLTTFEKEIRELLEQDIASRYYLERGTIEVSFQNDQDVQAAISLFENPDRYNKLLKTN
ncbi:MAG: S41 family peptidase [Cyclobacteriaceae bacterium]